MQIGILGLASGMLRDRIFWSAIVVAILFWWGLFIYVEPQFKPLWPLHNPSAFVTPALLYPVLEEIVFRGLVQDYFNKLQTSRLAGPITMANLATSLLFTALHFFYHAPLWAAAVFIPSLLFGYFKDKYLSLGPPIVLHVYYNCGYYWIFTSVGD